MDDIEDNCIICVTKNDNGKTLHYVKVAPESADSKVEERTIYKRSSITSPKWDRFIPGPNCWQRKFVESQPSIPLHVVISTGSGSGQAERVFNSLLQPFLEAVFGQLPEKDYLVHMTTSATSITTLTESCFLPAASSGKKLTIILLSGDGGIVDLINGLSRGIASFQHDQSNGGGSIYTPPTLVLMPSGTGNALANSTLITQDQTLGLSTLARGQERPLPFFKVHFSSATLLDAYAKPTTASPQNDLSVDGAVVASWGLHASLVGDSDTPEYRKHGAARFGMAAKNLLFPDGDPVKTHSYAGKVHVRRTGNTSANWELLPHKGYGYVLATPLSQLEAGFTISPASQPLDGRLRLVYFAVPSGEHADQGVPAGGEGMMKIMEAAYAGGKHVHLPGVSYEEIEAFRITFDLGEGGAEEKERWRRICIDGRIYAVPPGGSVVVERVDCKEDFSAVNLLQLGDS